MFTVTLKQLRDAGACVDGYNKVVCMLSGKVFDAARETYMRLDHDGGISLVAIANNSGIDDALWATRCLVGHDRDLRLYGVWCARQIQHLMTDERCVNALDVSERYANGEASDSELAAAWHPAWAIELDTALATARVAAWATARDAHLAAAGPAAWAAELGIERLTQKQMFIDMCNGNAPWQKVGGA